MRIAELRIATPSEVGITLDGWHHMLRVPRVGTDESRLVGHHVLRDPPMATVPWEHAIQSYVNVKTICVLGEVDC